MTKKRVTPLTRARSSAYPWAGTVLVQVDARYVPTLLNDTEARKLRFTWNTDADYATGYEAICRQQEALLMDIGERLISEIRATRAGNLTPLLDRDPATDPYTLQLPTLGSLEAQLISGGRSAAAILASIETILQSQGAGEEGQLDALLQIVALLSV